MDPKPGNDPARAPRRLEGAPVLARVRVLIADVMTITGDRADEFGHPVLEGQLLAGANYDLVRDRCEKAGFTPLMRDGKDGSGVEITLIGSVKKPLAQNWMINAALLLATIVTTVVAGAQAPEGPDLGQGLLFSLGLMGPLIAHELGHLLVSRWRKVPASLPYFIPLPLPSIPGTLGAVMVQREPWKDRKTLLEVALAGPLAGFLVAVPLFLIGAALSTVEPFSVPPEGMMSLFFGDSIVTALIGQVTHGAVWFMTDPVVNLNVLGLGAWFALLFTGLNLIPAGQLDGGHIAYALLGPRAKYVSYACIVVLLALALLVSNVLMLWAVMLFLFGRAHPPVLDETVPLQRPQYALIAVGVLLLIVSFAPNPMTFVGG